MLYLKTKTRFISKEISLLDISKPHPQLRSKTRHISEHLTSVINSFSQLSNISVSLIRKIEYARNFGYMIK